ncbi:cyanidin 3-O-glucoside 7-O-glucosyltransferase (acyl-glucose) isoform X2 [Daucus carota subsp. sativus]|uniref:Uncharacterized protein n=1 Tax=Daucus carota subsp. sativus TaxID=79200 RepID=A0A166D9C3_DAUCS
MIMPNLGLPRGQLLIFLLQLTSLSVLQVYGIGINYSRDDFPADFVFGSGTSAYQVEGAPFEDGKTPSTWDIFTHDGYVNNGETGDIACDGYHKYKEDVKLMADTGLEAYRFSISWTRLIPNGRGPINPKGLQFYNNLINELITWGIQPHVTLFHGDLPQSLEDEYGGWLDKKILKDFVVYADACFREFGDRVMHWTTFNEINMLPMLGYDAGMMPPRRCSSFYGMNCTQGALDEPYRVAHNTLLAHASAAKLYKQKYKPVQHGFIGLNVLAFWFSPYTITTEDLLATQRANDFYVGWFVNPLVKGDYPDVIKKNAGKKIPSFTKTESLRLKGSFDFLGVNHYASGYVKDQTINPAVETRDLMADMAVELTLGADGMEQYQGLTHVLEYFKDVYGNPPVYIHENGLRTVRNGSMSEELNDAARVKYMRGFIGSVLDALRNGANTKGYFTWSFLDVFELLGGYDSAYGLHYVDLNDKDLKRYPKSSATWYSSFLKKRGIQSVGQGKDSVSELFHSHL